MFGTLLLAAAVLYILLKWMTMRPKNFPPGLPCIPIMGSIPFLSGKMIHLTMQEWRKTFGPVVGLMFGDEPAVAVVDPETVLEVLKREEFQGRPDNEDLRDRSFGKKLGIFMSDGPLWVEQRRFTIRHLRDFGFGKAKMESLVVDEVQELMTEIKGKTVEVSGLFNLSMINVLWAMVAGTRFSRKEPKLQALMDEMTEVFRSGNPTGFNLVTLFPVLKKIAPAWTQYAKDMKVIKSLQEFLRDEIRRHKKSISEGEARDFMDVYIQEMQRQENVDSSFTEEGLIMACLDMFAAGGESVSNTLGFALLYMVLHPEVQRKVHAEIDSVVGRSRTPTLQDKSQLPYLEAVLTEVSRINTIAPIAPPHRATKDTQINGYFIPKDTTLVISLWSLLHDEKHWGDPSVFRPERFIGKDGKFVRDDWLLPFGMGKRVCLGEPLARNNLFLFFTHMMQQFSFKLPEGDPVPSTLSLPGFTTAPLPFRVQVSQR